MQLSQKNSFFIDDKCSDATFQYKYMKEIKKDIMIKHKQIYIKSVDFTFCQILTVYIKTPKKMCYRFYFFMIFYDHLQHMCGQF